MRHHRTPRLHAIYVVLDETELLCASIASVYRHVDAITVITTLDQDWQGRPRISDDMVERVRSDLVDPDRKVTVIVSRETSEARTRNRAMDWVCGDPRSARTTPQHRDDAVDPAPDYFLIVDADEIWEGSALSRLKSEIGRTWLPSYRVQMRTYFKVWTCAVEGLTTGVCAVRADQRFRTLRSFDVPRWRRGVAKLTPFISADSRDRIRGEAVLDAEIAIVHHGSYVGPRERIAAKLESFGHAHEVRPDWLTGVWDCWSPESQNLHPVDPAVFPRATHVSLSDLPAEISGHPWPAGWLEVAP